MQLITRMLQYDRCVYWAPRPADPSGQEQFDDPIEIGCRWEDTIQEYIDQKGEKRVSTTVVYIGEDLLLNGFLWHGKLEELVDTVDPTNNPGAYVIQKVASIPTIDHTQSVRMVYL